MYIAIFLLAIMGVCYIIVSVNAQGRTYDDIEKLPVREYGLLLGTSPFNDKGILNHYYNNRIIAASDLYKSGKVKRIIASGADYSHNEDGTPRKNGYNELQAMHDSLVAHGVASADIMLDYDGSRTLKSIVNLKNVYKVDSVTIISQRYHNQRAIFQADHYGVNAIGYNAPHSHVFYLRVKNILREFPARVKLFIDLIVGK